MTEDTAENRLKKTLFVVEATSEEQFMLWEKHSFQSRDARNPTQKWEQLNPGWIVEVGKLAKRPCCISVSWQRIDGQLVMFWYPCSQVSDSVQSEAWIKKHFNGTYDNGRREATCDTANFHHCRQAIREANENQG